MPITFKAAPHAARKLSELRQTEAPSQQSEHDLYTKLSKEYTKNDQLLLSSLHEFQGPTGSPIPLTKITTSKRSGFVETCLNAYNRHHNLIIRPDDIWLAIISQFSLFLINEKNSEDLREWFTSSKEKKEIKVYSTSLGAMPTLFRDALKDAVVDKDLIPWIIPSFSTTTEQDREVASYLLMGALKNYFNYVCCYDCGIPQVTLLGEKEDYVELLRRVDYITKFENEDLNQWAKLLRAAFLDAFEMGPAGEGNEKHDEVVYTWSKIAKYESYGSGGDSTLSGWITAFSYFGEKGTPISRPDPRYIDMEQECREEEFERRMAKAKKRGTPEPVPEKYSVREGLLGTGDLFPSFDSDEIAPGFAEVPIKLVDFPMYPNPCSVTVVAGSVGMASGKVLIGDDSVTAVGSGEDDDSVFPVNAWWIVRKEKDIKEEDKRDA
ncbi:hypothetical protein BJ508DRAFT_235794 [Ascobolus immersus RN42]|uniref:DUF4419 domain-containing protein n=1 Tax=Ascobolus immersus RN42 TaxID=1160509 RepID=A0A3N4IGJ8_ASCIM|nr:hypothetical protein BJ508DRAFT_235794 [Ascobolus immersus RN42]